MKFLVFSEIVLAGLMASGSVWADTECNVPVAHWQPREVLRQKLEQQGLQVRSIKVDDGCYEVRGIDAQQKRFKAKYDPDSLKALKMEAKDDPHGERRHERDQEPR